MLHPTLLYIDNNGDDDEDAELDDATVATLALACGELDEDEEAPPPPPPVL